MVTRVATCRCGQDEMPWRRHMYLKMVMHTLKRCAASAMGRWNAVMRVALLRQKASAVLGVGA